MWRWLQAFVMTKQSSSDEINSLMKLKAIPSKVAYFMH
jgi:hypothetical protein